jgi:NAD(P)-dependent dehydrogenase (short-subunit alcohol dehydrogenase family)
VDSALKGRHAVITGGGRAVGSVIAQALARVGARVTVMGRDELRVIKRVATLREFAEANFQVLKVESPEAVGRAFLEAAELSGPVDILVNNADAASAGLVGDTGLELWNRMLEVNLTGTFLCTRAALPGMMDRGWGRVVNIAGTAGLIGYARASAYCAAKHGVIGFTRALALESAARGVTVNAVCPGYLDSGAGATKDGLAVVASEQHEAYALPAHNPQGRLVKAEDVANAVLWLCLPGSDAVTGQAIAVAGGEVATG